METENNFNILNKKPELIIMIGSANDKPFLVNGLSYLDKNYINYEINVNSVHRTPKNTHLELINILNDENVKVIIGGSATATGLAGVISGYCLDTKIIVIGVRFTNSPQQSIIEDMTYNLSSMPMGVPLTYTGYNEKGFLHACILAEKILNRK